MNENKGARLPFWLDHPSAFSLWEGSFVRLCQTFVINARSVGNFAILDVIHINYDAVKKKKADSSISDSVPLRLGHLYVQLGITVGLSLRIVVKCDEISETRVFPDLPWPRQGYNSTSVTARASQRRVRFHLSAFQTWTWRGKGE